MAQVDYTAIKRNPVRKQTIVQALSFTEEERSFIGEMSPILGSNPRLIKRFINIYRIIKSHEYMRSEGIGKEDLESVLLILALSLSRYRPALTSILDYSQIPDQEGKSIEFLKEVIDPKKKTEIEYLKDELLKVLIFHKPNLLKVKFKRFAF